MHNSVACLKTENMFALKRDFTLNVNIISKNLKIKIYRTIILPVTLYGCETWSLTLREERRLRKIFEPMKNEVTGEWRKLHNEELNDL